MADIIPHASIAEIFKGNVKLDGNHDIRVLLCMSNVSIDRDLGPYLNAFTLDECDDTGYSRQAVANETLTEDDSNDRVDASGDAVTFSNNGDAARAVVGAVYFRHVTDDTDSIFLKYHDFGVSVTLDAVDFQINSGTYLRGQQG